MDANVDTTAFGDDPLWIAHTGPNCPPLPAGWSDWALYNYAFTGTVSGINGQVDLDRSNGAALPIDAGFKTMLPLILVNSP